LYDVPAIQWTIDRITAGQPEQFLLYYWVLMQQHEPETLVGLGGYKGPPNEGSIEIGYSVLAQYRRQGLASEAVHALVDFAFTDPEVQQVTAETFPALIASVGVLEKCGFELIGPGSEEGVIRYARSRNATA
jgi:RimJ/RimL family protein N-acetyltransferase